VINEKIPAQATTKTSKKGGKRTKRDPAAPKRGCSSYIFFCQDKRAEVKEANPDFKGTAITVELGRMWREDVSEEDKEKYTSMATNDKERYNSAMADYTPSAEFLESKSDSDSSDSKKPKKTKKDRKPGPKKARSAYIFFCVDKRADVKAANDDMNTKDITSELGRLWREDYKDDAKKSKKWMTMAKKDKERFEKEKAEWVDPSGESCAPDAKKSSKKTESDESTSDDEKSETESDEKTKGKKTKGKKKTAKKADKKGSKATGFIAFCQQTRETMRTENPDWSMKQVTNEMSKIWESMDDDEKSNY
jgi:structure-specific recognition protein 1